MALLCTVRDERVIVFVDQQHQACDPLPEPPGTDLQVFRILKDGLLFVEVTPLEKPVIVPLLERASPSAKSCP